MPRHSPFPVRRPFRHRSTNVTSEGALFLLFTLAIGIAAINTGNNLFYLLLAMMLSLILISGIAAEYNLRRLAFHRHLPDHLIANESAKATLVVKNLKSRLPGFSLNLLDVGGGRQPGRGVGISQLLPGAGRLLPYPRGAVGCNSTASAWRRSFRSDSSGNGRSILSKMRSSSVPR
jgi:hypothetical protein